MKKTILLFIAALAFCACERDFDVKDQMGDGVVRISFAPSNDHDSTFFYVQATSPAKNGYQAVKTAGESVSATVNGRTITLEKVPGRSRKNGCQAYWTGYRFQSGDEIVVEASIPGIESVYSSTKVPASFPEVRWNSRTEDSQICFDIEYENRPSASGHYGVAVMTERTTIEEEYRDGRWDITSSCTSIYSSEPQSSLSGKFLVFQPERINDNWKPDPQSKDSRVLAWTDIPGKSADTGKLQVRVPAGMDSVEENDGFRTTCTYRYRLVFYSFDENSYNHLRAQENIRDDKFAIPGLAPVSFAFTNVRNGAGVCGSYLTSETDWFCIK